MLPHQAEVPRSHSAVREGALTDADLEARGTRIGEDAVAYADVGPEPRTMEHEETVGAE